MHIKGGCKSSVYTEIPRSIWLWAINRSIFLVSCPIQADSLSRNFAHETEMELMATQLETFVFWHAYQKAIASDAYCISLKCVKPNIFPPFSLIPKFLSKL